VSCWGSIFLSRIMYSLDMYDYSLIGRHSIVALSLHMRVSLRLYTCARIELAPVLIYPQGNLDIGHVDIEYTKTLAAPAYKPEVSLMGINYSFLKTVAPSSPSPPPTAPPVST
jgi:hypothetical protein